MATLDEGFKVADTVETYSKQQQRLLWGGFNNEIKQT
jgi:hypothetical protein